MRVLYEVGSERCINVKDLIALAAQLVALFRIFRFANQISAPAPTFLATITGHCLSILGLVNVSIVHRVSELNTLKEHQWSTNYPSSQQPGWCIQQELGFLGSKTAENIRQLPRSKLSSPLTLGQA